MKRQSPSIIALLLLLGPWSHWALAQSIPTAIPYTGVVTVDGIRFNGNGFFKFAIVNQNGTTTYWSNDNTSVSGSEPTSAVTIAVSNGLYGIELGDTDRTNMMAIPPTVFDTAVTSLRVWFSDGVNGFQLLSPDRQLVSVPYAYQAEKANEVSGFGTVVKSIGLAGSAETPLRDEIVLEGEGSVEIQRPAGTNTIRIVGTVDTGGAVTDVACPAACISPDEISGPLTDALIPDLGTLSGILTDAQIPDLNLLSGTLTAGQLPSIGTLTGTVTDAQVPDLSLLSGVVRDEQVPSSIARVSDVISAVNTHVASPTAHAFSSITGVIADPQVPDLQNLSGVLTATQLPAISALSGTVTDLQIPDLGTLSGTLTDLQIPDLGTLSGVLIDAQIPTTIARVGQAAQDVACATPCVSSAEISGPLTDALIPTTIARVGQAAEDVACATPCVASAEISGPLSDALIGTVVRTITPSGGTPLSNDIVLDGAGTIAIQQSGNTITIVGTTGTAAATDVACATPCVSSAEISGTLTDEQIPATIARDAELTWANLSGIPPGFADGIDDVSGIAETDPQVGAISENRVPKWSSTALVDGQIYDDGTFVGIGTTTQTPSPAALLEVAGTVRVASLEAGYGRLVDNNRIAPAGATTTLDVQCTSGSLLSGGYELDSLPPLVTILGSWPASGNTWSVKIDNQSATDLSVNLYVVCALIQ